MSLTKRRRSVGRSSASKRPKDSFLPENVSLLTEILGGSLYRLSVSSSRRNELNIEQALFQKQVASTLKLHKEYPQVVNQVIELLEKHFEEQTNFQNCLLPTAIPDDHDVHTRRGTQDSLIRLLLGIDELQPSLLGLLLEKLPEYTDSDPGGLDIPRLVVCQIQWLDTIVQSKNLTDKLIEVLPVLSLNVQKELIAAMPEILPDSEHAQVVTELQELLSHDADLTASIIDAMTNLNISQELFTEVRSLVLKRLRSAQLEDLPVAIRFIHQSVGPVDAVEVITELRENLDFQSTFCPPVTSTPSTCLTPKGRNVQSKEKTQQSHELQIVETLRAGIRFQKRVADAWLKAIENVNTSEDYKVVDLFVLFILLSSSKRRKSLETLFRSKVKAGLFTDDLVSLTFTCHPHIVKEYLASILSLGDILLRSPDPSICSFAKSLYSNAFTSFDAYCRQEIIGSLVTHIGSGLVSEIDGALEVLASLVDNDLQSMLPYAVFLKGILDYIHSLTLSQIRKLFTILSALAFEASDGVGLIQDDVYIFVRKQLSSSNAKFKRIGVIGAIAAVRSLAQTREGRIRRVLASQSQPIIRTNSDVTQQVTDLLGLVRKCSAGSPEAAALFYDELADVLQRQRGFDSKVLAWINDTVVVDFQDVFLTDLEAQLTNDPLTLSFAYGLDAVEEGDGVAVNVVPLLLQEKQKKEVKMIHLAPHFRLLRVCEQCRNKGSLDGIDALLGCPLVLCKEDALSSFDCLEVFQREIICSSLLYAINWCREVVSAFCTQDDVEMRGKVIVRLKNVAELERVFSKCLAATPSYLPPSAHFDAEREEDELNSRAHLSKKLGKPGKPKKGNQEKSFDGEKDSADGTCAVENDSVPLDRLRLYFRELDFEVCRVLGFDSIAKKTVDSESYTKAVDMLQLEPPEIEFVLKDLYQKLVYKLGPSATKAFPGKSKKDGSVGFSRLAAFEPKEIAATVIELLPALCSQAETLKSYFHTMMESNDGITDEASKDERWTVMCNCFQLVLDLLSVLFGWSGFSSNPCRELFKEALRALVRGENSRPSQIRSVNELAGLCCEYVESFSQCVPKLSVAGSLTALMASVVEQSQVSELKPVIGSLAGTFLKQQWPEVRTEKTGKLNELLHPLVKHFVTYAENPVKLIETIATEGFKELLGEGSAVSSQSYPTLRKSSSSVYYKAMLEGLIKVLVAEASAKQGSAVKSSGEKLELLCSVVRAFQNLIQLVKSFDSRPMLASALKFGRVFIESFLRCGMPVVERLFRVEKDEIQMLLKSLQQCTRSLQHFCSHSKVVQDVTMVNHVPGLKRSLETFVYRVKATLAMHNCQDAFWLGNLKNRDLKGEEVLSQASSRVTMSVPLSGACSRVSSQAEPGEPGEDHGEEEPCHNDEEPAAESDMDGGDSD